ncbi:MAG: hypothetical protein KC502_16370 [Myxococcales bacterium]|nr:hypothetical protein [Myxococcales bacterium]
MIDDGPVRKPTTIEDLVIKASSHTPFFGVYLASHAISDSLCMCHASVGCKVKTQRHLVAHDGIKDAHNRMRYSQFIDEDLIEGSTQQLEDEVVAFQRRRNSQIVLIDPSTPISLQGQPFKRVCERLEEKTGVHVVHCDTRNYDADLWQGYDTAMAAILKRQTWPELDETDAADVAIVGYPFDRYEPDHTGTISELRRLLFGLGLRARAVWLAGEPYETLQQITTARHIIALPWAQSQTHKVLTKAGRSPIKAGLPMGLDGTARWLRHVARETGVKPERAERVIRQENARVKELFGLAHQRLAGRGFAAFGEVPRVAGMAAVLMEVGMVPYVLGTTHFSLGGAEALARELAENFGRKLPDSTLVMEDPTPLALRQLARGRAGVVTADGRLAAMPDVIPALARAEVGLGSTLDREQLAAAQLPWVEMGFPSELHHSLFPAPWMGPNGALRLLERVLTALETRLDRRR